MPDHQNFYHVARNCSLFLLFQSTPYQFGYTRDRDGAIRFVGLRLLLMYQMRLPIDQWYNTI